MSVTILFSDPSKYLYIIFITKENLKVKFLIQFEIKVSFEMIGRATF